MEINTNNSPRELNKTTSRKGVQKSSPRAPSVKAGPGIQKTAALSGLQEELQGMPEVRPERLEEGLQLKADPDYPNSGDLRELAKLVLRSEQQNKETDG